MRGVLSLLGLAMWLALPSSPAIAEDGNPLEGRRLFLRENCYGCHGGRGGGGMGPNLRDGFDDAEDVIRNGTPTGMPPYRQRLRERDIENIIAYLESLRERNEPTFTHWWEPLPRPQPQTSRSGPSRRTAATRRSDD